MLALAFHGHLLLLVLAPSPHSSGRGFGPRRSSGTLQLSTRCSVARLDAESLLGSAGRLVVAPYVLGKRCHIGRGSTPSVGVASTPRRGARIGCPSTRIVGRIASYRLYNVSDRPGFQKMQVVVQKKQDQIALSFVTSQTGDQWAVDAAKARHPST